MGEGVQDAETSRNRFEGAAGDGAAIPEGYRVSKAMSASGQKTVSAPSFLKARRSCLT
jgi:hypothetical protein